METMSEIARLKYLLMLAAFEPLQLTFCFQKIVSGRTEGENWCSKSTIEHWNTAEQRGLGSKNLGFSSMLTLISNQITQLQAELSAMQLELYQSSANLKEQSLRVTQKSAENEVLLERQMNLQVSVLKTDFFVRHHWYLTWQATNSQLEMRLASAAVENDVIKKKADDHLLALQVWWFRHCCPLTVDFVMIIRKWRRTTKHFKFN